MKENKYKLTFEELEAFVIETIRDPFLLSSKEWERDKIWMINEFLDYPRKDSKRTIKDGEEMGIIIFNQKIIDKKDIFLFNESKNFRKAIRILESCQTREKDVSFEDILKLVKKLEAKPYDQ